MIASAKGKDFNDFIVLNSPGQRQLHRPELLSPLFQDITSMISGPMATEAGKIDTDCCR